MTSFNDLFCYNDSANEAVFGLVGQLDDRARDEDHAEIGGSAAGLLHHLTRVERAFFQITTGAQLMRPGERTFEQTLSDWEAERHDFRDALPGLIGRLEEQVEVPWFKRSFTVEQALMQVVTHSVQHRAGIATILGRNGVEVPNLDYIAWLREFR